MQTIFLLTQGGYSDKRNIAAFSSLKEAEEYKWGSDQDIEEIEIDPKIFVAPPGLFPYRVRMARDGTAKIVRRDYDYMRLSNNSAEILCDYGYGLQMLTVCWARDDEHAVKIANERRTFMVANNLWYDGATAEF